MLGVCTSIEDSCRAYERLRGLGCSSMGPTASQCIEAQGKLCVWCGEVINSRASGHVCNCVGPEHEDCNPDRD